MYRVIKFKIVTCPLCGKQVAYPEGSKPWCEECRVFVEVDEKK